ncbi:hypothetical protein [Colwellia sp. BRX8-9]|uniref:hypothetical protein n=1 Tax=Colwellia sp. BRX8-9 TaxID=2759831 RepID=UPI0015F6727F|nr:hypothetical protein [Colwellia sp. BRX8-9]MBA6350172.1 hypothetical protein [Colwellia sp. BRX8-9]
MANTYIKLPFSQGDANKGKHDDGFWSDALKRHLNLKSEKGFLIGARQCLLDQLPDKESLDYWLRDRYARYPDVKQVVAEVKNALLVTGDFEIRKVSNENKGRDPEWVFVIR